MDEMFVMLKCVLLVLGQVLKVLEGHTDHVVAVAISNDGSKTVSGSWDKTVRVWSMETGEVPACQLIDCLRDNLSEKNPGSLFESCID